MSKKINRNFYRGFLGATFVGVNILILFGISSVLSYLNTGADRSSMLHLEVEREEVYLPNVTWLNVENPGRPLEKQTQGEIERDYLSSWYVRNIAYEKNDYYGIKDYYTDSARLKVYKTIDYNIEHKTTLKTTTLDHNIDLKFYSVDGKLAVLEDKNVTSFQQIYKGGKILHQERDTSDYNVMMLLEDGFWRIRHLIRNSSVSNNTQQNRILDSIAISNAKGLNYYPLNSPWDTFGNKFKESIIRSDFKLIQGMGLNTIRIFIPFEDFGKTEIDSEKLKRLKKTLELAEKYELRVVITLFDFYGNYDITDWTVTAKHASLVVNECKKYNALLAWDIKNEPDLDFESRGKKNVLNWIEQMIYTIKKEDPNHSITVGWSSPEAAVNLADKLDFVSFHYYKNIQGFNEDYNILKDKVGKKSIMLQEYGLSSYSGIWNLYSGSDENQANYYKTIQPILLENNISYLAWTLYDFESIPTSVAGSLPWKKNKQHYFGFFDKTGKKKSSYDFFTLKK